MTQVKKKYLYMPLEELKQPKDDAMVHLDRYWVVTDKNEVIFHRRYSGPQCNRHKGIADRLAGIHGDKVRVEFVSMAFVPIAWGDYLE